MGANLIIVVFAVVVIGGMGSILGSILTGFALGIVEGLTKVFYPEASSNGDLRHHGDRAAGQARRPVREGRVMADQTAPARRDAGGHANRRHAAAPPGALRRAAGAPRWSRRSSSIRSS